MLSPFKLFSNWWNGSGANGSKKDSQTEENNLLSKVESTEKITIQSPQANLVYCETLAETLLLNFANFSPPPQENLQFNKTQVQSVLSDFEKLNFKNNKCFDEIADDYETKENSSLFNYVILNKRKEIINVLDRNLPLEKQEEFRKSYGEYILQIDNGISYGKELQNRLQSFEDKTEEVLSDFKKLNFNLKENECQDSSDFVNYNNGRSADPFDKIANYYRWKKNIFLFNYVVLSKQKEIMDILDKMLTSKDQEQFKNNFKKRLGRYLLRIDEGMNDAKEFLNKDELIGFFDGRYVPDAKAGCPVVNHYDNLSINITKLEQSLETSCLFSKVIKRMEINKNEVQRVKIYNTDKRIVTIEKNDKQQRNYLFEKSAVCSMEVSYTAKDDFGKDLKCSVVLNIIFNKMSIEKSTINGKDVELKEILELVKQNNAILIGGKDLYTVLGAHQTPQNENKIVQSQTKEVI